MSGFGRSDYNKLRERFLQRQQKKLEGDQRWFRPEMGQRYRIRILPPPEGRDQWYVEYGVHYNIPGAEEGEGAAVTCAKMTTKQPCPVCEFVRTLWRSGTEADKEMARSYGAKRRFASNVLVMSGQNPNDPQMWAYGPQVWDQLSEMAVGSSQGMVMIDDPDAGYNFNLNVQKRQTGTQTFPHYVMMPEVRPCPIPDKGCLAKLFDVHGIIHGNIEPYDVVHARLLGEEPVKAAVATPPPAKPAAPKVAAKPASPPPPAEPAGQEEIIDDNGEEIIEEGGQGDGGSQENQGQSGSAPASGGATTGGSLVERARAALKARKQGG